MRMSPTRVGFAAARARCALLVVAVGLALALAGRPAAAAETGEAAKTGAAMTGAAVEAGASAQASGSGLEGLWTRAVLYVRSQQRELHRQLAGAIKALRRDGSPAAAWSLIVLSFLYGVFHAAGPGHGKAVISTYLLTHRSAVSRGIWLSALASLAQGLTAILLVLVLVALIGWTRRDAQGAVGTLETASFALIAALGLSLAARALWAIVRALLPAGASTLAAAGGAHPHEPADLGCGHSHGPSASHLSEPLSLKTTAAIVLSIGIRPCSGAVLVLLFAEVLDLRWAGVAAVLAMSLGTAAAVAALAVLAVNFRRLAGVLAGGQGRHVALAGQSFALLGGLLITALGATLFFGSLGTQHPLL